MKVKIPRQKIEVLDVDGDLSTVKVPAQEVELKIEAEEIKPKPPRSICTCIVPRFDKTGPCKRCGKPLTWDYEVVDLLVQNNFDMNERLW